jgi:ferrous iron transport protein B
MITRTLTVALAGNPNVGKSTIFNALTGTRQHVGNWPGKTVEKKEGLVTLSGQQIVVVDLPGTYSLTAYSVEEIIARDFLIEERPGAVVVVADASNLERNLYLVMQVLELELPTVVVLNMCDVAREYGITIDLDQLSEHLGGVPIIQAVGNDGIGVEDVRAMLSTMALDLPAASPFQVAYSPEIGQEIIVLSAAISAHADLSADYVPRWLAIKLLEGDPALQKRLEISGYHTLLTAAAAAVARVENQRGEDTETIITDDRYMHINAIVRAVSTHTPTMQETLTDRIDRIVTHRLFGIPIFLLAMWIVFQFTANISVPLVDWIDGIMNTYVSGWIAWGLGLLGLGGTWVESLLIDGVLAGVGGVLVFVPVLMSLYIAISLLEDSGYMARAAFVMDRAMRMLGLHGKSFLPMLVGFGCTVPAVYATRTLENDEERRITGFLLTFMSCGARLPVYVVFGAAFFGAQGGNLIFGMYLLGILVALLTGFFMRHILYRNHPPQPFIMELPPYRMPRMRDVLLTMWDRTASFVRKATTVIMAMSVLIWVLLAIPVHGGQFNEVEPGDSLFGQMAGVIAPVFAPAGFGDWQAAGSLVTGIVAKEVIIGSLSQVYVGQVESAEPAPDLPPLPEQLGMIASGFGQALLQTGQEIINIIPRTLNLVPGVQVPEFSLFSAQTEEEDSSLLAVALSQSFSPLAAVAFSALVLLYVPCITTLAAMRQEFGVRWTLQHVAYTGVIAWFVAVLIYQGGTLLGGL